VDAAIASPPGTQFLEQSGKQKTLAYLPAGPTQYKDYYGSAWGAPTGWLESEPDTAKAFCRAVQKGITDVKNKANADEVTKALIADTNIPGNIAKLVVGGQYDPYSTEMPKATLEATLKGYVDAGILKSSPPVTYDSLIDDLSTP
jgi:NitT/TauT family transport system substrate-binding protein